MKEREARRKRRRCKRRLSEGGKETRKGLKWITKKKNKDDMKENRGKLKKGRKRGR